MAAQKISNGQMSAKRLNVLQSVYNRVGGGQPITKAHLTCSSHPDGLIAAMGGAPVNFNKFKAYYNNLGMFLASDDHFVLMVVNAWHHMESPYDEINTVNLRMRCYKDDQDDSGDYITLINDCQKGSGKTLETLVQEQEGTTYKVCKTSE